VFGVRVFGVRVFGVRVFGVRVFGVRVFGVRKGDGGQVETPHPRQTFVYASCVMRPLRGTCLCLACVRAMEVRSRCRIPSRLS
jgi:hypothetical protein